MAITKINALEAENIIRRFKKIQHIRQKSLEILLDINKKTSAYKLEKLIKKLEDIQE